jgi:predicted ATPase
VPSDPHLRYGERVITRLEVKNHRCLKDVSVDLTPLHAFIGPNDSGKSTLLQAVQMASRTVAGQSPFDFLFAVEAERHRFEKHNGGTERFGPKGNVSRIQAGFRGAPMQDFVKATASTQLVRFDPDAMRAQTSLIVSGHPITLGERGDRLAAVYDAIRDRDNAVYTRISQSLTSHFSWVKVLGLRAMTPSEKVLALTLDDGAEVLANAMSEGILYFLGFAALSEIVRPSIFLVEEPENGLHPARIREVVKMLRDITEDKERPAQVLIATHSPLVVNELKPDEVSVVTRTTEQGTKVTRIKDTPNFQERAKVYALGELWLTYADGVTEAPLFDKRES